MSTRPALVLDLGDLLPVAMDLFAFEARKVRGFYSQTEVVRLTGKSKARVSEAVKDGRLPLVEFRFRQGGVEKVLGPYVSGLSVERFLSTYRPAHRPRKGETAALLAALEAA